MALLLFCVIVQFTIPFAVLLSALIFVAGCKWPISINACLNGTANLAFMKRAAISASAADDITNFITFASIRMDPLIIFLFSLPS